MLKFKRFKFNSECYMRQIISLIALTFVALLPSASHAEVPANLSLYGISAGTKLKDVAAKFRVPAKRIPFEDGWVAYVYQFKGHNLIVETSSSDSEEIVAVQIQGNKNPPGDGLLGVNLGDRVESALKKLGAPIEQRPSVDEKTNKPVAGSRIYQYENSSFEGTDGKVSSMKIHFRSLESESSLVVAPGSKIMPVELLNYTFERWKALVSEKYECGDATIIAAKEFKSTPKGVITERWVTSVCGKERSFVPILAPDGSGSYIIGFGE